MSSLVPELLPPPTNAPLTFIVGVKSSALRGFLRAQSGSDFVDDFRADDLRVRKLHWCSVLKLFCSLRGKAESSDTIIQFVFPLVLIAERDGVVGIELVVEARLKLVRVRGLEPIRKFDRVEARVQHRRIDDGKFVDVSAIEVDEEGRLFVDGATEVSIVHLGIVPRFAARCLKKDCERSTGGIAVNHELAVEFVGTGLW